MVEIFTQNHEGSGPAERSQGNSVNLAQPSTIYFGKGTAGLAYYEKAGADLKVTLLDGQVVTLQNFFAVGQSGAYSALLTGEGGAPEVTGLIAPEPFVPRDDAPVLTSAPPEAALAPQQAAAPQAAEPVQTAAVEAGGDEITPDLPNGADASSAYIGGVPIDLIGFAAANIGLLWAGIDSGDDEPAPAEPTAMAAMSPEIAALLLDPETGADEAFELSFEAQSAPLARALPETAAYDDVVAFLEPAAFQDDLPIVPVL